MQGGAGWRLPLREDCPRATLRGRQLRRGRDTPITVRLGSLELFIKMPFALTKNVALSLMKRTNMRSATVVTPSVKCDILGDSCYRVI